MPRLPRHNNQQPQSTAREPLIKSHVLSVSHADGVAAFGKVAYIVCKLRLASLRTSSSELLRLNQRFPSPADLAGVQYYDD